MRFVMSPDPAGPWKDFLEELDSLLDEPFELHCIGGFAMVAAYGFPRGTNDLDYRTVVPFNRMNDLQQIAGPSSRLARKHRVHLHYTAVESMPENYDKRLTELFPGRFENLRLFVPDLRRSLSNGEAGVGSEGIVEQKIAPLFR
jgi:hypothetical protein